MRAHLPGTDLQRSAQSAAGLKVGKGGTAEEIWLIFHGYPRAVKWAILIRTRRKGETIYYFATQYRSDNNIIPPVSNGVITMVCSDPALELSHVSILFQFTSHPFTYAPLTEKAISGVYTLFYNWITKTIKNQYPGILIIKSSSIPGKYIISALN